MIRHIVMWKVRGSTPEEKQASIELVRNGFHGLRGLIPGLIHLEIGIDTSRVGYACDVVLYSEFESQAALDAYANHPKHLRVRDELIGIRIERYQVDYEVVQEERP